jgi:hypothetical protein
MRQRNSRLGLGKGVARSPWRSDSYMQIVTTGTVYLNVKLASIFLELASNQEKIFI